MSTLLRVRDLLLMSEIEATQRTDLLDRLVLSSDDLMVGDCFRVARNAALGLGMAYIVLETSPFTTQTELGGLDFCMLGNFVQISETEFCDAERNNGK